MANSFHQLAIEQARKQAVLVDPLTEESPLLSNMQMMPASHGLWNVYPELQSVTGGDLADFDAAPVTVGATKELKRTDLSILSGVIPVGQDLARKYGGRDVYVASQLPSILRETGNNVDVGLFYNNLRQFAITEGRYTDIGGSADTNYSMVFIKYLEGENIGLFDPDFFGQGIVFEFEWFAGGGIVDIGGGVPGYKMLMKSNIGLQLANARYVYALVNIDIDSDPASIPTREQISQAITEVRGAPGNTQIIMHPNLATRLGAEYKVDQLQLTNADTQINTMVKGWNGIPFVEDFNLLAGTEDDV